MSSIPLMTANHCVFCYFIYFKRSQLVKWLIVWLIECSESILTKNNFAVPKLRHVAFVARLARCKEQRVVNLSTCNFYCQTDLDSFSFVIKGLMWNLVSVSQELRLFKFDRLKAGRVWAKTCLTGQRDRRPPVTVVICSPVGRLNIIEFWWDNINLPHRNNALPLSTGSRTNLWI